MQGGQDDAIRQKSVMIASRQKIALARIVSMKSGWLGWEEFGWKILLGIAWYCLVLLGIALYSFLDCLVLICTTWFWLLSLGIALYCCIGLYCIVLKSFTWYWWILSLSTQDPIQQNKYASQSHLIPTWMGRGCSTVVGWEQKLMRLWVQTHCVLFLSSQ